MLTPCLPSNADCNPVVLAIVRSSSPIVACLPSNADCNPVVFAIVKDPSDTAWSSFHSALLISAPASSGAVAIALCVIAINQSRL